ncbi:cytochrome c3 family protein [Candidatus Poribacteria bacterium]
MKTRILVLTTLLSIFFVRSAGLASTVHGDALVCATCHTIHYSQQHDYSGDPGSGDLDSTPMQAPMDAGGTPDDGPYVNLLRTKGNALCLACHDDQVGMPDVVGSGVNGLVERSAGFFPANETDNFKGHNLASEEPGYLCLRCHFGGEFAMATVKCVDCHDPHGREPDNDLGSEYRYRNLWWAYRPGGEPPIKALLGTGTGLEVYEQSNVAYTAPSSNTWREVTNICLDCHHTYSGDDYTRNESGGCILHPVTDSERGAQEPVRRTPAGETAPDHWESESITSRLPFIVTGANTYTEAKDTEKSEVFCLTCHKAHGSGEPFALRWDYSSMTAIEGCQQCHNK